MEQDNMIKKLCFLICTMIFCSGTQAAILWAGGEDIDFPNGGTICLYNGPPYCRTAYARIAIYACASANLGISHVFQGGAVTSAWLSFQVYHGSGSSVKYLGFTKSGTNSSLWMGTSASSNTKIALWKYDGTTWTELAAETTGSLSGSLIKIDMQVINYGSSATVNIYSGGTANPKLTYTGNVLAGAAVSLDSVILRGEAGGVMSEIIVSTTDSRTFSLATHVPNAAGDTNQWTGSHTNIIPNAINDANNISNANAGDIFEANLGNLTTTNFNVLAVKASARMLQTGSGITSASLGVKTNSTVNVPSATTLSTTWGTRETFYSINPVTSSSWTPAEVNALQIHLESAP